MATQLEDSLAAATMTDRERHVVARLIERLREEMGADLHAIWLYGSRARGDATIDESDVDRHSDIDLLAIADGGHKRYDQRSIDVVYEVANEEGVSPVWYSVRVRDPEWLAERRAIRSFFVQEVDRDKLVLYGSGSSRGRASSLRLSRGCSGGGAPLGSEEPLSRSRRGSRVLMHAQAR